MARTIKIVVEADTAKADQNLKKFESGFKSAIDGSTGSVGKLRTAMGGLSSALGVLAGAAAFHQIAQFGIDLDKSRNAMTALTGSVEAANKKLAELRELVKSSPGVTTNFATELFKQLKAIGGIGDQTINNLIKSLGKLNAVFGDIGPDFVRNLVQIFQQGFERSDVKEALGRVPIFEQLLEKGFGTKDPEKLRKLKDAGKLTMEGFLSGMSGAIENTSTLKNVQESLGGRLQKSFEETKQKLAELGEKMLSTLLPVLDKLLPPLSKLLDVFNRLPDGLKATTIGILAVAPALSGVASAIGGLRIAAASLGAFLLSPAGLAVLALIGAGLAVKGLMNEIERNETELKNRFDKRPRDLQGNLIFQEIDDSAEVIGPFSLVGPGGKRAPMTFSRKPLEFDEKTGKLIQTAAAAKNTKTKGTGGGVSAAAAAAAAREKAAKAKQLIELTSQLSDERQARIMEDMENILSSLNQSNFENAPQSETTLHTPAELARNRAAREERFRQINLESAQLQENTAEKARKEFEKLEPILSNSERFMKGFSDATESAGDAFERFGANVASAFGNIGNLFDGLKRAVLGFFKDLVGSALQNLVRSTLGGLFGQIGGALGGIFGGGFGGLGGGTFGGSVFSQAFAGALGGGISAPGSISSVGGRVARSASSSGIDQFFGPGVPRTAGKIGGFSLSGIGQSLAGLAPALGFSLGGQLGGQSTVGNILGGAGGLLSGGFLAATATPGIFSAGAAAFFSNPITAIAGVGLLVGGLLLGKAKQRKKDEEASGEMLRQALTAIDQLAAGVSSGAVDGTQARAIFENQILSQFIAQIRTLKTKSVVDSRLKNQVQDLRNVFEARIPPLIAEQAQRRSDQARFATIDSKLVPQFARGGVVPGIDRGFDSVTARMRPGEMVLTVGQQASISRIAGSGIFRQAGVPGIQHSGRFAGGGIVAGPTGNDVIIDKLMIGIDAEGIFIAGGSGRNGERLIVKHIETARTRGRQV